MSFQPHPDALKRREVAASDGEWSYWPQLLTPAVDFAKAAIRPDMTEEQKQKVLRDTLNTMEEWIRADAKP
jgi:Mor family transcriptional regulator